MQVDFRAPEDRNTTDEWPPPMSPVSRAGDGALLSCCPPRVTWPAKLCPEAPDPLTGKVPIGQEQAFQFHRQVASLSATGITAVHASICWLMELITVVQPPAAEILLARRSHSEA